MMLGQMTVLAIAPHPIAATMNWLSNMDGIFFANGPGFLVEAFRVAFGAGLC